jgi:SAM-dependent methyltransferase
MNEYWDGRYKTEGKIWGDSPSRTAAHALDLLNKTGIKTILVPGSGYGRNTKLFSGAGFEVTGVEISSTAYNIALKFDPASRFYNTSALDLSFLPGKYDAIYCFNVLHLFGETDRKLFIGQCLSKIQPRGVMFFTVFSEQESSWGKGREVEKNTFESKPGRPVHYFTARDLATHFKNMEILESDIIEDPEDHGAEGPHTHRLRYIYMKANRA